VRFEPSGFTQPFDIQHHIVISSPLCVFLESKLNVQANMIGLEMVNRNQNQSNLNRWAERRPIPGDLIDTHAWFRQVAPLLSGKREGVPARAVRR
jgi:hypothetical protein